MPWLLQCGCWRTCLQEVAEHLMRQEATWAVRWLACVGRRGLAESEHLCQDPDATVDSWYDIMEVMSRSPARLVINSSSGALLHRDSKIRFAALHAYLDKQLSGFVGCMDAWRHSGPRQRHARTLRTLSVMRLSLTHGCRGFGFAALETLVWSLLELLESIVRASGCWVFGLGWGSIKLAADQERRGFLRVVGGSRCAGPGAWAFHKVLTRSGWLFRPVSTLAIRFLESLEQPLLGRSWSVGKGECRRRELRE